MVAVSVPRIAEAPLRYDAEPWARGRLGEPSQEPLNESELSWIWAGQRYPEGALSLIDGRALRVLNPGRPGGGAGPDYLDAVLEIDGATVRGDVELHVRSSGFRAHGHDADPAYNGVALHVVFRADDGGHTALHDGTRAPVAAFAPWFDSRREELQRWLAGDALWREPCRDAVWRLGEPATRNLLREAGLKRFMARSASLKAQVEAVGEAEALWRSLLDTIGVGGDREGFRRLALAFPASLAGSLAAEDPERLSHALLSVAGLAHADDGALPPPIKPALVSSGRPANRPERRLTGVAALMQRCEGDLPVRVRRTLADAASVRDLVAAWLVSKQGVALIGPDRAREVVLNVVLPFAALDGGLHLRAIELAEGLGVSPPYGKTAFLERNLGSSSGRRLVRGALEQQGLLAFLHDWCSQGGCGRCPFS